MLHRYAHVVAVNKDQANWTGMEAWCRNNVENASDLDVGKWKWDYDKVAGEFYFRDQHDAVQFGLTWQ